MVRLWDCHMHTEYSGDSEASVFDMIDRAKELGLSGITITDHLDWDFKMMPHHFDLDIGRYLEELPEIAATDSTDEFEILVGIELGLQEHLVNRHKNLLSEHHFDFVIGSIHQVDGKDPYYPECYKGRTVASAYRDFLKTTLNNIEAFPYFDSLGHLDFMLRYGGPIAAERGEKDDLSYRAFSDIIDEILVFLIKHDLALEVNTGPYKKGLTEPNPSIEILKRYFQLGGKLLTLGADAHEPGHIAIAFDKTLIQLRNLGFDCYHVYKNRKPVEIPL